MFSSMPEVAAQGPRRLNATSVVDEPAEKWPCSIDDDLRQSLVGYLEQKLSAQKDITFFSKERTMELKVYVKETEKKSFEKAKNTKEYLRLMSELISFTQDLMAVQEEPVSNQMQVDNSNGSDQTSSGQVAPSATEASAAASNETPELEEKKKFIRRQLILLVHAHKCLQRENEKGDEYWRQPYIPCTLPQCNTFKNVLNHMKTCNIGGTCKYTNCATSHEILTHCLKECVGEDCPACKPLTRFTNPSQTLENIVSELPRFANLQLSETDVDVKSAEEDDADALPTLRQESSNESLPQTPPRMMKTWHLKITDDERTDLVAKMVTKAFRSHALQSEDIDALIAYAMKEEKEIFEIGDDYEEYYRLLRRNVENLEQEFSEYKDTLLNVIKTETNKLEKENVDKKGDVFMHSEKWRLAIAQDIRNQVIWRIVKAIFPSADPDALLDQNMMDLITYARKVEKELFNMANSRGEYYHISAEKINKMEKALKEKKDEVAWQSFLIADFDKLQMSETATEVKLEERPVTPSASNVTPFVTPVSTPTKSMKSPKPSTKKVTPSQDKDGYFDVNELRNYVRPVLDKLNSSECSIPFRMPVDPQLLNIPDYFDIIKKPMDLMTISTKLDSGAYNEPWTFCVDMWLMFDNAWLYNRINSKVYKYCTKLSKLFTAEMDPLMRSMGFCCSIPLEPVVFHKDYDLCKHCMFKFHKKCAIKDDMIFPEGFLCIRCGGGTENKYWKEKQDNLQDKDEKMAF